MVVCKFYAKGYCKYGQDCRFEHELQGGRRDNSSNVFGPSSRSNQHYQQPQQYFPNQQSQPRYFGQQQQQMSQSAHRYFGGQSQQQATRQPNFGQQQQSARPSHSGAISFSHQQYIELLEKDAVEWERSGQWPFSVYAPILRRLLPVNERPSSEENLPGFVDISQEEMRWEAMQAHAAGQFPEYLQRVQSVMANQQRIRLALQKIDPSTAKFIDAFEHGQSVNPVGTAFDSSSAAPAAFGTPSSLSQQTAKKTFSFTLPAGSASPSSSFSFKLPAAQPAFQQQQPVFQQPFGVQPAQPAFQQQHPFQSFAQQPSNPVVQQPTLQVQQPLQQIQQTTMNQHPSLSSSDMEQFKAEKFSFGRIPRQPPPKELR